MKILEKFQEVIAELKRVVLERDDHIDAVAAALLANENVFMIGLPGLAKSYLFRELFKRIEGAKYFERLLTKTTVPEELFGAVDLPRYTEQGEFVRNTSGMLPEADFAFLDEPGKASSAILNTLLTIMNERIYQNGPEVKKCPLKMVASAANEFFDGSELDALYDRYVIRLEVTPLKNARLSLLTGIGTENKDARVSLKDIISLREKCAEVEMPKRMFNKVLKLQDELRKEGIEVSDRTLYRVAADRDREGNPRANILKATALLNGRDRVFEDDLIILQHVVWRTIEEKEKAATVVYKIANPWAFKAREFLAEASMLHSEALGNGRVSDDRALEINARLTEIKDEIEGMLEDETKERYHVKLKETEKLVGSMQREIMTSYLDLGI